MRRLEGLCVLRSLSCAALLFFALLLTAASSAQALERYKGSVVRVGVVRFTTPAPYNPIVGATIRTIKQCLASDYTVEVVQMAREDLEKAVVEGRVDVFLSSAGFYRRLVPYGAKDLATAMSPRYPDPNHGEGAAIVVSNRSAGRMTIDSLRHSKVAVPSKNAFSGFHIPMAEIARRGYDYRTFFSAIHEVGDGDKAINVFDELLAGRVDAAFAKQCVLEAYIKTHPQAGKALRVIEPRQGVGECARTTDLYPTWTLGSSFAAPPDVSRRITSAVLAMPATENGLLWGVATDFSLVDRLLMDLHIGPYEYLNKWTIERVFDRFWPVMLAVVMLIVGLILHSLRVAQLVRVRTAELERSLKEQQLLQKQANEAVRKLNTIQKIGVINQISSILAHELRQPVGAIACYLDGLKSLVASGNAAAPKVLQVIGQISAQVDRIAGIMQKVRSYRKNPGGLNEHLNISITVSQAIETVRHSCSNWPVEIRQSIEPDLMIRGDALEIELLTINLTKNSAEAVRDQPHGWVNVALHNTAQGVELIVSDNGPIKTQAELRAIAERFETTKDDGLGLGLQIVYGIAERHRAKVVFGVRASGGLIVQVTFPAMTEIEK